MNKKGFTLTELLAVITILSIVIGIGMMSAISIMKKSEDKARYDEELAFKDAAILYCIDKRIDTPSFSCKDIYFETLVREMYIEEGNSYCAGVTATVTAVTLGSATNDKGVTGSSDYVATLSGKGCKR